MPVLFQVSRLTWNPRLDRVVVVYLLIINSCMNQTPWTLHQTIDNTGYTCTAMHGGGRYTRRRPGATRRTFVPTSLPPRIGAAPRCPLIDSETTTNGPCRWVNRRKRKLFTNGSRRVKYRYLVMILLMSRGGTVVCKYHPVFTDSSSLLRCSTSQRSNPPTVTLVSDRPWSIDCESFPAIDLLVRTAGLPWHSSTGV